MTDAPQTYRSRFLVWTDHDAQAVVSQKHEATWFWTASGPRGHMGGCEFQAEHARERAYAAMLLLSETKR